MNKRFKALAAICASAMLLSTSAFAANTPTVSNVNSIHKDFAVSFDSSNKLTVTAPTAAIDEEQMTLLVLDAEADPAAIDESDILYINQQAVEDGDFEAVGLISTWLDKATAAGKTHTVKLGYYWDNDADASTAPVFAIATAAVTVSGDAQTMTVAYGNVNGDANVNSSDASLILQKAAGKITGFTDQDGKAIPDEVGNVNGDANVNSSDASLVLQKAAGKITGFTDQDGNPLVDYTYTPAN